MKITERYASAIRSSNLKVDPRTSYADTDVLGAMGIAERDLTRGHDSAGNPVHQAPLAVALERLFLGDNNASTLIVEHLSVLAWAKAKTRGVRLKRIESVDMARACLAWHRDGACKACGKHGVHVIQGSTTLGNQKCKACKGTGMLPFERQFRAEFRDIAAWLVAEMQREQGRAGPAAMKKIAPLLDL